jgi:hypothetical protein
VSWCGALCGADRVVMSHRPFCALAGRRNRLPPFAASAPSAAAAATSSAIPAAAEISASADASFDPATTSLPRAPFLEWLVRVGPHQHFGVSSQ